MNNLLSAIGAILLMAAEVIFFAIIIVSMIPFSIIAAIFLAVVRLWDFLLEVFKSRRRK